MNGMDVLRQCAAYGKDREKLLARRYYAQEARTRMRSGFTSTPQGNASSDKIGNMTAQISECEYGLEVREEMYRLELAEASRLMECVAPDVGRILYGRYVMGLTMRQIAGEQTRSEGSIRGLRRRGEVEMENLRTLLEYNERYAELAAEFDHIRT